MERADVAGDASEDTAFKFACSNKGEILEVDVMML